MWKVKIKRIRLEIILHIAQRIHTAPITKLYLKKRSGQLNIALNPRSFLQKPLKIAQDILEKIFPHPAKSVIVLLTSRSCTANDCPSHQRRSSYCHPSSIQRKKHRTRCIDNIIIQQIFKKFPSSSWNFSTLALNC
ncbi:hypothetical protein AVEN_142269-1 [Araneus ventricosus]|uniref:Uncharacterized protein n=1 Tax=Araneus ventricosus TaxID=182803 RepID=A0A4Y2GN88_ARAVE|nr:hypothetical protein AVEN_142269-1 [Araneus ventricosus]